MLFFSWPCPNDKNQCVFAHSAGYFLKETESLLPIAHLPWEIQDTTEAEFDIQYLSFANVKGVKHINVHPAVIICFFNKHLLSVCCVPGSVL